MTHPKTKRLVEATKKSLLSLLLFQRKHIITKWWKITFPHKVFPNVSVIWHTIKTHHLALHLRGMNLFIISIKDGITSIEGTLAFMYILAFLSSIKIIKQDFDIGPTELCVVS